MNLNELRELFAYDFEDIHNNIVTVRTLTSLKDLYKLVKNDYVESDLVQELSEITSDLYFIDEEVESAIYYYLDKDNLQKLKESLEVVDTSELWDYLKDCTLMRIFRKATKAALFEGVQQAAVKDFKHQLSTVTHNGFWIEFDSDIRIKINIDDLNNLYLENGFFNNESFEDLFFDFSYKPQEEGYSGFDGGLFNNIIKEAL